MLKRSVLVFSLLAFGTIHSAQASSYSHSCGNFGNTIQIELVGHSSGVRILTSKYNSKNQLEDRFVELNPNHLEIDKQEIMELPETKSGGCSSRKSRLEKLIIKRKDGRALPNAYNRLVEKDGSLQDYFICVESISWMCPIGE